MPNQKSRKKVRLSKGEEDGRVEEMFTQLGNAINGVVKGQQEFNERLTELEKGQDAHGKKEMFVAGQLYNTDREHLSEMTNLPTMRVIEPFALATTLGKIFDKQVMGGELSLADIYMDETKKLFRGYKGKLQELAAEHAKEAEAPKTEGLGGEALDLGRGV